MVKGISGPPTPTPATPVINVPNLFHANQILHFLESVPTDQFFEAIAGVPEVTSLYMLFEPADLSFPWGIIEADMF